MKMLIDKLSILFLVFVGANGNSFCTEYQPNINIDDLPELSKEFETNIQLNLPVTKHKTTEVRLRYDRYDYRAELITDENVNGVDQYKKQAFFYNTNELLDINTNVGGCSSRVLNQVNPRELFFGISNYTEGGIVSQNMNPPEDVLHFGQKQFTFVKDSQTTMRGIPVDHYKSCETWPLLNSNYHIDWFFMSDKFRQGARYSKTPVPVAAFIQGEVGGRPIRNEYQYFRYRPSVTNRKDLFAKPEGVFCEGQTKKMPMPEIPDTFSFVEEVNILHRNLSTTIKATYSYSSKVFMIEDHEYDASNYQTARYRTVHDYYSGVSYRIDKDSKTCEKKPISDDLKYTDSHILISGLGESLKMKLPNELFHLDDNYFYAGQRYERGRKCNVFVSKRTDFKPADIKEEDLPLYWVFEMYFLATVEETDIGVDGRESVVPITLKVSAPEKNYKYVTHFYDFDSHILTAEAFDITKACFQKNEKLEFGIKYLYPGSTKNKTVSLKPDFFNIFFALQVKEHFYGTLIQELSDYNFSPWRAIPPKLKTLDDYFILYTGFTDRAPDILQFTKTEQSRCDTSKAKDKISSDSASACATACLDSSVIASYKYRCLSFDYCVEEQICSFYNFSHVTTPDVNLTSASFCDHYSKTVNQVDAVSKEEVFRTIQNRIGSGDFDIDFDAGFEQLVIFKAVNTIDANYEAEPDAFEFGSTAYFDEFLSTGYDIDFDLDKISQSNSTVLVRTRYATIDECARLCVTEPAFSCGSMIHNNPLQECKWSSLTENTQNIDKYLKKNQINFNFFTRDLLYNYRKYGQQTSSLTDGEYVAVDNLEECVRKCETSSFLPCRSFNFCEIAGTFQCKLSDKHANSADNNATITVSPICDHYSKKTIFDYQLVPETRLSSASGVIVEYFNTTVEQCAQHCEEAETFICRSFDFSQIDLLCLLYKENLRDISKDGKTVQGISDPNWSHYSRIYFYENGQKVTNNPKIEYSEDNKYNGGTIFGVTFVIALISFFGGVGGVFVHAKYMKKKADLPSMEFINPNYVQN